MNYPFPRHPRGSHSLQQRRNGGVSHHLNAHGFSHIIVPLVIIVGMGLFGTFYLVLTHAAAPSGSVQFSDGINGFCLDNFHSGTANFNKVDVWSCNKSRAQSWTESTATATAAGGTITNANGRCLDVAHSGVTSGTKVDLFPCNRTAAQNWHIVGKTITNPHAGLCLTATGTTGAPQTILATCSTTNKGQVWTATNLTTTPPPVSGGGSAACRSGGSYLWSNLAACGWPAPSNTGLVPSQCPSGLAANSGSQTRVIRIATANAVIKCENITGRLEVAAPNVTIENSTISGNSGKTGTAANGTAVIFIDDGASATVSHVTIRGNNGVHACIWHQGNSLNVEAINCSGINDGIFSWASSSTAGNNFTIKDSYFDGFTTATANGHEDGYQTEGASNGTISHNTYAMTTNADSAVAIWDSLKSSSNITVSNNLITGGGFAIYAQDYSPGDGAPGNASAAGGYSETNINYINNSFSTHASGCVGQYGIWFTRPTWVPYKGGPTDGWHRSGNKVLETGQNVDNGNPTSGGALCS